MVSWSHQQVGDLRFFFVAAGGKVHASCNHIEEDIAFTNFRLIGLGTSVHVSLQDNVLLLVTEGKNCYNSHSANTRSAPLVCEPETEDAACDFALDYSLGTVEDWFTWLRQKENETMITPCNEFILHGTFSCGHNPSGALFPFFGRNEQNWIMVAHEPYPAKVASKCGIPMTGDTGIVISALESVVVTDKFIAKNRWRFLHEYGNLFLIQL